MKKAEVVEGKGEGFDLSGEVKHPAWHVGVEYLLPNPAGIEMFMFHSYSLASKIQDSIKDFAYRVLSGPVEVHNSCGYDMYTGLLNGLKTTISKEHDRMRIYQPEGTITEKEIIRHEFFKYLNWGCENHAEMVAYIIRNRGFDKELVEKQVTEIENGIDWD